ncbi:hypothetical protein DACRYDRAFT_22134 [Dacryopinax primogenitus]|uniref:Uncharacterized protein n=1 Tax=Dacryopinax primogenitus (strain DJM 731) TaxID=1858805 RepID=M5FYX0_DACPD|nr:uncharacterized protein DACRYDRAFT_22134 [Dacryopinax primogenitus]EJU01689.1 hypothetical protein DACRYDRAFT_22134 [Dacryopinax primogenitus]
MFNRAFSALASAVRPRRVINITIRWVIPPPNDPARVESVERFVIDAALQRGADFVVIR